MELFRTPPEPEINVLPNTPSVFARDRESSGSPVMPVCSRVQDVNRNFTDVGSHEMELEREEKGPRQQVRSGASIRQKGG